MIFRRHSRWPPKRLALRLLPSDPRNPSNPRLPTVSCWQSALRKSMDLTLIQGTRAGILLSSSTANCESKIPALSGLSPVSWCKSFRMRSYKQTPCFARFWPKLSACNSFRMRSYANRRCNSFRMRSYKKSGGRGFSPSRFSNFAFRVSNFARAHGVPDSTLVSRILVPAACGRGKRCSA